MDGLTDKYPLHKDNPPEYNDPLNIKCDVISGMSHTPSASAVLTVWNFCFLLLFLSVKKQNKAKIYIYLRFIWHLVKCCWVFFYLNISYIDNQSDKAAVYCL